jgi:hypothetical protein
MHIPEQLFASPFLKDIRTQQIELVTRRAALALIATNTGNTSIYQVSRDRIFILTGLACSFAADGAGGTMTSCFAFITFEGGAQTFLAATNNSGVTLAAGQPAIAYAWSGSIWIPPAALVSVGVTVNVSAGHSADIWISGITIPRGNVAVS